MIVMTNSRTLAFEIGVEEIPAFDLADATSKLADKMSELLKSQRISHGDIKVLSTPRRLDVIVEDVVENTEAVEETFKGPSLNIAFDKDGKPTKAACGFARGKGVEVDNLEIRDIDGTKYVFAITSTPSKTTKDLLPDILRSLIDSIHWPKSMRWNVHSEQFSRPVRWLCALFGCDIVPMEYAGISPGREIWGHRVLSRGPHTVESADSLEQVLEEIKIVSTQKAREELILSEIKEIERNNPDLNVVVPEKTLCEVVNLCEHPTVLLGSFDEAFLEVPEEIIVDAMLMHQRYFPIYIDGKLTNKFIIVSNGNPAYNDDIVNGNERVVAARLYDARFFYQEDLRRPLEDYVSRLDEVVFQEQLGTMRDKTSRIEALCSYICDEIASSDEVKSNVVRAAKLAKADLVTNAVIEFTSVQGVMGSYYAKASGENEAVSLAIAEHYRPRFATDDIPSTPVGCIVAMADKIDTICGLFAINQQPTGTSDPFALRRAALGVIAILSSEASGVKEVSLSKVLDASLSIYADKGNNFDKASVKEDIISFFLTRTKVMLKDAGCDVRVIDAVLATGENEVVSVIEKTNALSEAINNSPETFTDLAIAFSRADNLRDASLGTSVDKTLFNESERALNDAIDKVGTVVADDVSRKQYLSALEHLSELREPIDGFFESTMVMDENPSLRDNRIKLLNLFTSAFEGIADFSKIGVKSV